ncbi:MAG: hypothetical protein ACE5GY_04455 [Thermodesulfobacteriota bacterium]
MSRTRTFISTIMAVLILTASYAMAGPGTHTGTVIESITGGGYTYMKIEEGGKSFWIAGPQSSASKGEKVSFSEQIWMSNLKSKALGRTFDRILFVNGVQSASAAPAVSKGPAPAAAGTYTIEEVFSRKAELAGKVVRVRGKVVKVSNNIMNRTWVHIQDGTGGEGTNKIIFRSVNGTAKVGSTVTAQDRLETDRDFGFGYFYPVIVEDASFTK